MLPYLVILLALFYLVMHYTGLFDEVARLFSSRRSSSRSKGGAARPDEQRERLQVFEDFFGGAGDEQDSDEDS